MRSVPRTMLAVAGAAALIAPVATAAPTAPREIAPEVFGEDSPAVRAAALDAAAAWRDLLPSHRAPWLPAPSDTESVILILTGPAAALTEPAGRAAAAAAISDRQAELDATLASLGASVTFRYRVLVNGIAVRLPSGRLEALAALPQVRAIVPVTYLAPAQAGEPAPPAPVAAGEAATPAVAGEGPLHIALIDAGVDVSHPWLGGGMGPTFPILGGADLVDGDDDPRPGDPDAAHEAHGTQMASIVLRSAALQGLAPGDVPRLLAYRVVAAEPVGGRVRPLARTDRVLAALERAVDPNQDGSTQDGAEVVLIGLADGFAGAGADPLSDALASADRVGTTVVAPAGNNGPTFSRPGSVSGLASGPTVIAVGGLSASTTPRTADLDVRLGPASARLGRLPLMGPAPTGAELPVVVLRDDAGISAGDSPEVFRTPDGTSRVEGALVVLARGGGSIPETVSRAAEAGAAAVALWDEDGAASFPSIPGDSGLALPTAGLGPRQGAGLVRLTGRGPELRAVITANAVLPSTPTVTSFSSWGPTPDGRQKPDLVAPAVDVEAAWPGRGADGSPRAASLTGTSAAAAQVAALALRLRVDHPTLGPRAVQSLLSAAALPATGIALQRQGAGVAAGPVLAEVRIEPAIVASRPRRGVVRARISLSRLTVESGRYSVVFRAGASETVLAPELALDGPARALNLVLPTAGAGEIVVRNAAGEPVAGAPVLPSRPVRPFADAIGTPLVSADGRLAEVRVRLGVLRREDQRVRSVRVHGVRLSLRPVKGGAPLAVAGAKQQGAWAAGTYRFLVARRLASGLAVPPGRYRLRVSAVGSDGRRVHRDSGPFRLG